MNYTPTAQPWAPQNVHNAQMVLPTRANHPMFAKWWPANWVWQTFEITETIEGKGKAKATTAEAQAAKQALADIPKARAELAKQLEELRKKSQGGSC